MNRVIIATEGDVEVSDGFHTFAELYEHRHELWISLCGQRADDGDKVWRSKVHSDGTSYPGWFLMGIGYDAGQQISYHLPDRFWAATEGMGVTLDRAPDFDGHTSADVLKRLRFL